MIPRITRRSFLIFILFLVCLGGGFVYRREVARELLPPPTTQALLNKGKQQLAKGHYQKALHSFQTVFRQYSETPEAPEALMAAAAVLDLYLERPYQSIRAYLLVIRDYPLHSAATSARKKIADIYKNRLGDYEQASVYYQRILEEDFIRKDLIQYELADCYFRLHNYEQSRIELETLLANHPRSPLLPEACYRLATAYVLEENFVRAEETYQAIIKDYPENPLSVEARFEIGSLYARQEKLVKALEIFRDLEGVYPREKVLKTTIQRLKERIAKKKKAI